MVGNACGQRAVKTQWLGRGLFSTLPPPTEILLLLQPRKGGRWEQGREAAQPRRRFRGFLGKGESATRIAAERLRAEARRLLAPMLGQLAGCEVNAISVDQLRSLEVEFWRGNSESTRSEVGNAAGP